MTVVIEVLPVLVVVVLRMHDGWCAPPAPTAAMRVVVVVDVETGVQEMLMPVVAAMAMWQGAPCEW